MIASFVIPALFVSSGLFALAVLFGAWRGCGAQLRAIRAQLNGLDDIHEFQVRLALTEVQENLPVARRSAVRPLAVRRQQRRLARRAAA